MDDADTQRIAALLEEIRDGQLLQLQRQADSLAVQREQPVRQQSLRRRRVLQHGLLGAVRRVVRHGHLRACERGHAVQR